MTPVGQLLQRNSRVIPGSAPLLWINPPPGFTPDAEQLQSAFFLHQDYADFRAAGGGSERRTFGDFPVGMSFDHVVMSLPKSKARLEMMVECLAAILGSAGSLWLAGENRSGIRSAKSVLDAHFAKVRIVDKARHCVLFEASAASSSARFDPGKFERQWTLEQGPHEIEIHSMPGVFAHGRLDDGTALLAGQIQGLEPAGRILDMACGSGILGALLKQSQPEAELVLADTDALALASAHKTMAANKIGAKVVASDGFSDIEGRFDLVVSNPPFHQGFVTRTGHGMSILNDVRNFLRPGGQLVVVVNRHLPYRKWLDQVFDGHVILAENTRFQVLQASMP